jgi:hypothetical protein
MFNKKPGLHLVLLNQVGNPSVLYASISRFGREHATLPNVFEMSNSHATTVTSNTLAFL